MSNAQFPMPNAQFLISIVNFEVIDNRVSQLKIYPQTAVNIIINQPENLHEKCPQPGGSLACDVYP